MPTIDLTKTFFGPALEDTDSLEVLLKKQEEELIAEDISQIKFRKLYHLEMSSLMDTLYFLYVQHHHMGGSDLEIFKRQEYPILVLCINRINEMLIRVAKSKGMDLEPVMPQITERYEEAFHH